MNWEEIFTSNNPAGGRMINVISGVAGSEASPYTADNPSGGRAINVNIVSGGAGAGVLQLQNNAPLDTTLRSVTDQANTVSPLQLSTTQVAVYNGGFKVYSGLDYVNITSNTISATTEKIASEHPVYVLGINAVGGVPTGAELGAIAWGGNNNVDGWYQHGAVIMSISTEAWSTTGHYGSDLRFYTTLNGQADKSLRGMFDSAGILNIYNGANFQTNQNSDTRISVLNLTDGTASESVIFVGKQLSGGTYGGIKYLSTSHSTSAGSLPGCVQLFSGIVGPLVLNATGDGSNGDNSLYIYTNNVRRFTTNKDGNSAFGGAPDDAAILSLVSTTQGFLPPRMTTAQKTAIGTPAAGLVVYDTTLNKLCVYTTAWEVVTSV